MILVGLFLSFLQVEYFISRNNSIGLLFSIPVYLWAWLSMFTAGLEINPNSVEIRRIFSALMTTLASVGTVTWIWLSSFAF